MNTLPTPSMESSIPVELPDYLEIARRVASAAKKVFHNKTELAVYLNTNSRGKFVAVVFRDKVVIGPGNRHPEDVLADYVSANPDAARVMEVPPPSQPEIPLKEPEPRPTLTPQELGDFTKSTSELTSEPEDVVSSEHMPGAPPRYKPAKIVTGEGPVTPSS